MKPRPSTWSRARLVSERIFAIVTAIHPVAVSLVGEASRFHGRPSFGCWGVRLDQPYRSFVMKSTPRRQVEEPIPFPRTQATGMELFRSEHPWLHSGGHSPTPLLWNRVPHRKPRFGRALS